MRQIWNIFRKDCRHFWPEILLSLISTGLFVSLYPYMWQWRFGDVPMNQSPFALGPDRLQNLAAAIAILVPVGWLLLINRVIHAESPASQSQFWITRPYVWYKLLGEKLLFLAVFIALPFFLAQVALLHNAGFTPFRMLPLLLSHEVLIAAVLVLPLLCLAAVTSSLLRSIGTLLSVAMLVGLWIFFSPRGGYPNPPAPAIPYLSHFLLPFTFLFLAAILYVQYAKRRVWLARGLLLALPLTLTAIGALMPDQRLLMDYYPDLAAGQPAPVTIALDSVEGDNSPIYAELEKYTSLRIPLIISGIAPGHTIDTRDIRLTIESSEGFRWTSSWQALLYKRFEEGRLKDSLNVSVERDVLLRLNGKPVNLAIELALTEAAPGTGTQVLYQQSGLLALPGIGLCSIPNDSYLSVASCLVPFHEPTLSRVTMLARPAPCDAPAAAKDEQLFTSWMGDVDNGALNPSLSPVTSSLFYFLGTLMPGPYRNVRYTICPGMPLVVTPYHLVRRFTYTVAGTNVRLPSKYIPK